MNNPYSFDPIVEERRSSVSFPALMSKVYLWMMMALVMTALTAYGVAGNERLVYAIMSSKLLFYGLLLSELAVVVLLSARIDRMSFLAAGLSFAVYAILNGVTMSVILMAYTETSVAMTFFVLARRESEQHDCNREYA